jgi:predicted DNA-binding ribbon-helix-helix protein
MVVKRGVAKRSIVIAGRKTSISLEEPFWISVNDLAASRNITLVKLVEQIDKSRTNATLSSAIRFFVLDYFVSMATQARISIH